MATMAASSTEDAFWFENLRSNVFLSRKMLKNLFFFILNLVTNPFKAEDGERKNRSEKSVLLKK